MPGQVGQVDNTQCEALLISKRLSARDRALTVTSTQCAALKRCPLSITTIREVEGQMAGLVGS